MCLDEITEFRPSAPRLSPLSMAHLLKSLLRDGKWNLPFCGITFLMGELPYHRLASPVGAYLGGTRYIIHLHVYFNYCLEQKDYDNNKMTGKLNYSCLSDRDERKVKMKTDRQTDVEPWNNNPARERRRRGFCKKVYPGSLSDVI